MTMTMTMTMVLVMMCDQISKHVLIFYSLVNLFLFFLKGDLKKFQWWKI